MDGLNRGGGGVCTYIQNCVYYRRRLDKENQFFSKIASQPQSTL